MYMCPGLVVLCVHVPQVGSILCVCLVSLVLYTHHNFLLAQWLEHSINVSCVACVMHADQSSCS